MDSVGVRELRQNLSVYLRRVKAGEALKVTEHGHAVALLRPLPDAQDDPLADLVAEGVADPPKGPVRMPEPVVSRLGIELSDVISMMRDEDPR